jgi:hypothetical protein
MERASNTVSGLLEQGGRQILAKFMMFLLVFKHSDWRWYQHGLFASLQSVCPDTVLLRIVAHSFQALVLTLYNLSEFRR